MINDYWQLLYGNIKRSHSILRFTLKGG